jgi:diguanylate cyclase (GGDEF)-like protein
MNARTSAHDGDFERIRREHALLIESIEVTPVAVAVYDDHDRLIFWNKPYERVHASAFEKLRGKADRRELYYADLVRVIAEATMAADLVEGYVRRRVQEQRDADGVGVDRNYPGVGWFRISKFKTRSGAIAGFALDINENKHYEARLENEIGRREALEERLRLQANTDALTQLANRGAFLERAEMEFLRGDRFGDYLSVIMMDVDLFKQVNDTYGHGIGDTVLASLARATAGGLRGLDMVGRIGGEEFAMLLVHTTLKDAAACAEKIRQSIAALVFHGPDGPFGVTASFGVTQTTAEDRSFAAVMSRADQALYSAKHSGRNKVCSS